MRYVLTRIARTPLHRWVPAVYVVLGLLWVSGSDVALNWLVSDDPRVLLWVGGVKGIAFVVLTGVVFAVALRLAARGSPVVTAAHPLSRHSKIRLLIVLSTAAFLLAVAAGLALSVQAQAVRAGRARELRSAASLAASQLSARVQSRLYDAAASARDPVIVSAVSRWALTGDRNALEPLPGELAELRQNPNYQQVEITDAEGRSLPGAGAGMAWDAPARGLMREVASSGQARVVRSPVIDRAGRFIVAAPIPWADGRAAPAPALLVAQVTLLEPGTHPLGSVGEIGASARAQLVQLTGMSATPVPTQAAREVGEAFRLTPVRQEPGLFSARSAAGTDVLAVLSPVRGTDWYVLTRINRAEAYGSLRRAAVVGAALVLGVFLLLTVVVLQWHRLQERSLDEALRAIDDLKRHFMLATRFANDAILLLDSERRIVDANDKVRDFYGVEPAELIGRPVESLRAAGSEAMAEVEDQYRAVDAGSERRFETRHARHDGTVFPVEVTLRRIEAGGRTFIQSVVRDVSARCRAEEALRKSEGRYRGLFNQAADGIFLIGGDEHILDVNPAGARLLGDTKEKLLGVKVLDAVTPGERSRLQATLRQILEGRTHRATWLLRRKDESEFLAEVTARALDGDKVLAIVRDQSRIVETRRQLRRQRNLYELLAHCGQAIVRADTVSTLFKDILERAVDGGGFLFAWAALVRDGVLQLVDVVGRDRDFAAKLGAEIASGAIQAGSGPAGRALREGVAAVSNDYLADPNAGRWHEWARREHVRSSAATPIRHRGEVVGVVALYAGRRDFFDADVVRSIETLAQDIGIGLDRLAAHAELEDVNRLLESRVRERTRELSLAKQAAESADRAKSIFLSTVSHELRSPLHSIIGYSSLLAEDARDCLDGRQQHHLQIVQDASQHLLAIINDLLDVTRIDSGRVVVEVRRVALAEIVGRLAHRFELAARYKGLVLEVEPPDDDLCVESDARRVEQTIANLLDNAIKYTPAGSVRLWVETSDQHVALNVADTGPGIDPADQKRIFERFTQLERPDGTLTEGTGLGLAIAAGLAQALGGRVDLVSAPGAGSVFSLILPRVATTAAQLPAARQEAS